MMEVKIRAFGIDTPILQTPGSNNREDVGPTILDNGTRLGNRRKRCKWKPQPGIWGRHT
jgi:hypothetical protein